MIISLFGESCTGKSTIAECIRQNTNAEVFSGKDYLRLKKNPNEAQTYFCQYLKEKQDDEKIILYVVSEKEHLALLPEKSIKVYCYADIDTIKQRFAERMHGNLPAPVATMLEKKHGLFEQEEHDMKFETTKSDIHDMCVQILNYYIK